MSRDRLDFPSSVQAIDGAAVFTVSVATEPLRADMGPVGLSTRTAGRCAYAGGTTSTETLRAPEGDAGLSRAEAASGAA